MKKSAILEQPAEPMFVGGREVRRIPAGWKHPKDARGRYAPLLPGERWPRTPAEQQAWTAEYGTPARREAFMPDVEGLDDDELRIAAYEATSEGTPISPAFPNTADGRLELARYCAENCTTFGRRTTGAEAWAAILFGQGAGVTLDGTVHSEG